MIVVTGAAGFISSCLVSELNQLGHKDIVVVDDFSREDKVGNLDGKSIVAKIPRMDFFAWAKDFGNEIDFVFHLGARTDTTEFDKAIFDELNLGYSQDMWNFCAENNIPLVYASSGATYGIGENGYSDSHEILDKLKQHNIKPIIAINKIDDRNSKKDSIMKQLSNLEQDFTIFPISALRGDNIDELIKFITDNAKEKEWLYDEDALTNLPERFIASEITREQLFLQMQQELPYKLTVESESWEILKDGSVKISQVIIVSRQNYKAMILGNKGERIKNIGTKAREEIAKALDIKPHLFLFVKVREDWDTNPLNYKYLGLKWKK